MCIASPIHVTRHWRVAYQAQILLPVSELVSRHQIVHPKDISDRKVTSYRKNRSCAPRAVDAGAAQAELYTLRFLGAAFVHMHNFLNCLSRPACWPSVLSAFSTSEIGCSLANPVVPLLMRVISLSSSTTPCRYV